MLRWHRKANPAWPPTSSPGALATTRAFQFFISNLRLSALQVIIRDTKTCFFCNGSYSIGISRCFEPFLKADVAFGISNESCELFLCHGSKEWMIGGVTPLDSFKITELPVNTTTQLWCKPREDLVNNWWMSQKLSITQLNKASAFLIPAQLLLTLPGIES